MTIMPLATPRMAEHSGCMEILAILVVLLLAVSVWQLARVIGSDRPARPPRSHYVEAASAHERWERVSL